MAGVAISFAGLGRGKFDLLFLLREGVSQSRETVDWLESATGPA